MKVLTLGVLIMLSLLLVKVLSTAQSEDDDERPGKVGGWTKMNIKNKDSYKDLL